MKLLVTIIFFLASLAFKDSNLILSCSLAFISGMLLADIVYDD